MAESIVQREHADSWTATLLAVWSRRRWLALLSLAVPLAATLGAARFLPNRYRAGAVVVIEHALTSAAPAPAEGPGSIDAQLQRLHEENLSRAHLQGLVQQFQLYRDLAGKVSPEGRIAQMRRDIHIESKAAPNANGRSQVAFQISFGGGEPERVAQVTNTLASFYVDRGRELRDRQVKSTISTLEAQVADMKRQLEEEGARVNEFIAQHLQELPDQVPLNLAALERLNALLVRNRDSRDSRARPPPISVEEPEVDTTPPSDERLAQLTEQLNALRRRFTDQHPDVAGLKSEIAQLNKTPPPRRAAPRAGPATAKRAPQLPPSGALEGEKHAIERSIAAAEQRVYNAPKRERELQILLAPYQMTRQIYGSLLAKLEDARLAAGVERQHAVDPFRILDPAIAPREPVAPDRLRLLVGGAILSLLFAVLVVMLAERLDTSFHSLDELRAFTRVPVLTSVPNIVSPHDRRRKRRRARLAALLIVLAAGATGAGTWALVHGNESLVRMLARNA